MDGNPLLTACLIKRVHQCGSSVKQILLLDRAGKNGTRK
jgi:hypothetical protein